MSQTGSEPENYSERKEGEVEVSREYPDKPTETRKMRTKELWLRCDCHSLEHTHHFEYWTDEPDLLYFAPHLNHFRPWWERVKIGIGYMFGRKSSSGYSEYCDTVLKRGPVQELVNYLQEFLEDSPMECECCGAAVGEENLEVTWDGVYVCSKCAEELRSGR